MKGVCVTECEDCKSFNKETLSCYEKLINDLNDEILRLRKRELMLLNKINEIVDQMEDLRYG
jgi:hypothetical protein